MGTIKGQSLGHPVGGHGVPDRAFCEIWNSGKAIVDVISLLVVTPVVAFYILLDWDRMVSKVDQWIPRDYVSDVRADRQGDRPGDCRLHPRPGLALPHPRHLSMPPAFLSSG